MLRNSFAWFSPLAAVLCIIAANSGVPDVPFWQEFHQPHPLSGKANDVRAVEVDGQGRVWAATADGLFYLDNEKWTQAADSSFYDLAVDDAGTLWASAWNGLFEISGTDAQKVEAFDDPISVLCITKQGLLALGPDSTWERTGQRWKKIKREWSGNLRDAVQAPNGDVWIATGMELVRKTSYGVQRIFGVDDLFSTETNAVCIAPDGRLWIGEFGGIDIYENGTRVDTLTAEDGLPYFDVRSISVGPEGRMWIGTGLGVARYDGETWSLRHSKRWLLSDDVRDVAFDANGNAWVATSAGISAIMRKKITLADKAQHYYDVCMKRHVRKPWFVEKCYFPDPNDLSHWEPRDDDNDGSYTGIYLVMEALRYAVTGDPDAKEKADRAYDALEMLQTITETDGFVARTIIPSDWTRMADANRTYTKQEAIEHRISDPRYKPVEVRWRPSKDGKWLWKGDTSSDEITGHFYTYLMYYDLCADAGRKARVEKLVRKIMDYIIEGGYMLRDTDGEHTRWGVWAPEYLLHDPDWRSEAPINAYEILSYLKATYHITGDSKYQREYKKLINKYNYAELARRPKTYGRSERTHIDDDLMTMVVPALMKYETDPKLKAIYREGYTWAYRTVDNEMDPYFNFTFGMLTGDECRLEDNIFFLRDQPLDLRQWRIDNARREDVTIVRRPMLNSLQLDRMLPPSERGVMRWDKNPWETVSGDFNDPEGRLESSGVFWLLPYWMGRYAGYIDAPASE
ncbi:regulator [bacterium]|nr:regulator [bacterium]